MSLVIPQPMDPSCVRLQGKFFDGLIDGSYGFGGEESAGASFPRKNGNVWTTDKDGIIIDLLACEITARTCKDPAELYRELVAGIHIYWLQEWAAG